MQLGDPTTTLALRKQREAKRAATRAHTSMPEASTCDAASAAEVENDEHEEDDEGDYKFVFYMMHGPQIMNGDETNTEEFIPKGEFLFMGKFGTAENEHVAQQRSDDCD